MKRILLSLILLPLAVAAARLDQGDYRFREDVEQFIERLARSSDYSEQELIDLFSQVKNQRHLFERMNKPAEKLEWHQYRKIFLTDKRISRGVAFWQRNRELLERIERDYGVPPEIVVAIVGVETFYGQYKGKAPVFDTLVTFAFDYPKRARFFTAELEAYLRLAKENGFDPRSLKGSYAGAMGMPQFIASSYRSYAVDYDGDGQADLFESLADVLGSVANYFRKHGWKPGAPVVHPLQGDAAAAGGFKTGLKPAYRWAQLKAAGFRSEEPIPDDAPVSLLRLKQPQSEEYWAGRDNFYVITRYNHSELYAMAVHQLGQAIRQARRQQLARGEAAQ
jgi:membrane-bound lytic murein transglycosylase B